MKIRDDEITFIFQGPFYEEFTKKSIIETRKIFKNSEFIFSTWNNQKPFKLPTYVKKVFSEDPGSMNISSSDFVGDSTWRQKISVINGLKYARTKYVVKIRSDTTIYNKSWVQLLNVFNKSERKYSFFEKKIIVPRQFFVNPQKIPLLFHPGDWFFFGTKKDIYSLFNYTPMSTKEASWFKNKKKEKNMYQWNCRYRNEQHILVSFLKKKINLQLEHQTFVNKRLLSMFKKIIANNFIILDPDQLKLDCLKNPSWVKSDFERGYFSSNLFFSEWLTCHKKYTLKQNNFFVHNLNFWKLSLIWFCKNFIYAFKLVIIYNLNNIKILFKK